MTAKLQLLCTQMWRRILIPTKFSRCTVLNKVRRGDLYVCKQIYYGKRLHMGHVLWYTKDQLVAKWRLPKVQTRLINDYLHFHNIYDGPPDPGQLLLIPVSQYEFVGTSICPVTRILVHQAKISDGKIGPHGPRNTVCHWENRSVLKGCIFGLPLRIRLQIYER